MKYTGIADVTFRRESYGSYPLLSGLSAIACPASGLDMKLLNLR